MGEEKAARIRTEMQSNAKRDAHEARVAEELKISPDLKNFPTVIWTIAQYLGVCFTKSRIPFPLQCARNYVGLVCLLSSSLVTWLNRLEFG